MAIGWEMIKMVASISKKEKRLGMTKYNKDGVLMKIIEYENCNNIIVEFQDKYKTKVHAAYREFENCEIKNPYYPSIYGIGVVGNKYPVTIDGKLTVEYNTWKEMLMRSYYELYKKQNPTYQDVTCCEEWLLYENFYEWLHSQENFDKWLNDSFALDKDIIVKGNKVYSPDTCCLVPQNVNKLFLKSDASRGDLPIGVTKCSNRNGFIVRCMNPMTKKRDYLGYYIKKEKAFLVYKGYKEDIVKQVAQEEYDKGNITKKCYDAMMKYEVDIED